MAFWCWHKWTKWINGGPAYGDGWNDTKRPTGIWQYRTCEKCGKYVEKIRSSV